jgi:hypothetical protein
MALAGTGDDRKVYPDHVTDEKIQSVVLYGSNLVLTEPILGAGPGGGYLHLGFDDLGPDLRGFYYTFVHCEENWEESDLNVFDYLSGVTEDHITDFKNSFSTTQHYVHYNLDFPTAAMRPTKSGNYALVVYEDGKRNYPVFIKHFMVVSSRVDINATWDKATEYQYQATHQAIKFTLNTKTLQLFNPFDELIPIIKQNDRTDNMIAGLKPVFVNGNQLDYNLSTGNIFPGDRDFRRFDLRSVKVKRDRVRQISNDDTRNIINVDLFSDEIRTYANNFQEIDINGKFFICDYDTTMSSDIEGEYVMVHFYLPASAPYMGGNLYIFGGLTNWEVLPTACMEYNPKEGRYEGQMYLKQGYYNYQYVFVGKDGVWSNAETEGDNYETENNYQIFIYYHPVNSRYTQLVGYSILSTNTNK